MNYVLEYISAVKTNTFGRGSGGELLGYKKSLKDLSVKFKKIERSRIFEVSIEDNRFFIVPIYLNCSHWQQDYDKLRELLCELGPTNLMMIGDFNGRIGLSQNNFNSGTNLTHIYYDRKSKDEVCDAKGAKILELADAWDCHVLNGSCEDDRSGEFTFIRGTSCSVIDYCFISGNWIPHLDKFEVAQKTFSDHMPLEVSFKIKTDRNETTDSRPSLPPKLQWNDRNKEIFQRQLNSQIELYAATEFPENPDLDTLVTFIKNATCQKTFERKMITNKQKWFDKECLAARNLSFAYLKLLRTSDNINFKVMYASANKTYKELCKIKKRNFDLRIIETINKAKNTTDFWKAIKVLSRKTTSISANLHIDLLKTHFSNLLNTSEISPPVQYATPLIADEILDAPFSLSEIETAIRNSKDGKAPGEDRIPFEFFKNLTPTFLHLLTIEFNRIFDTADAPMSFRSAIIFPLHKRGNPEDPTNYRGISFLNTVTKLFSYILYTRLSKWVESKEILTEFQAGFRKNHSTVDQIFSLVNIAEIYKKNGKKLYAFFVDFRAAFDSIPREALFYKLYNYGISSKIITVIRAMYKNNVARVWDGKQLSDEFQTPMGVKQGCVLSALLFSLYINDIIKSVKGGIVLSEKSIPGLMYADDIVFLADSIDGMQLMMNRLQCYCKVWNLSVNLSKSKIMIFRSGGGRYSRMEKWTFQEETVEIVKEYKYLGVLITPNLNLDRHLRAKVAEAKRAMCTVWRNCYLRNDVSHIAKYKVFRATATAILFYGAQVWGYLSFDAVEKFLHFFVKNIFKLPSTTPNYMLHLETGIGPLFLDTLKLHFNYVARVMEMGENRLPRFLLGHIINSRSACVGEWYKMANDCSTRFSISTEDNFSSLKSKFDVLLMKIGNSMYDKLIDEAESSLYRTYYSKVNHFLEKKTYFLTDYTIHKISTIFKVRGELLSLNFIPHRPDLPLLCDLCNRREREDVFHFLGVCPILKEFRKRYFGFDVLSLEETLKLLNGERGWEILYLYCLNALRYRTCIINESF